MKSGPEDSAGPVRLPVHEGRTYSVDARHGKGVQVGDHTTQYNYFTLNYLTWTDGVAPPPLASISGEIDSHTAG